jgi:hypothetical protein
VQRLSVAVHEEHAVLVAGADQDRQAEEVREVPVDVEQPIIATSIGNPSASTLTAASV